MTYFTSDLEFPIINIDGTCDAPQEVLERVERKIEAFNYQARKSDVIVHIGDFIEGTDYSVQNAMTSYEHYASKINASLVNIQGNHIQDRIYSMTSQMRMLLDNRIDVIVQHKPAEDDGNGMSLRQHFQEEHVNVCLHGHVSRRAKYKYNPITRILNINLTSAAWNSKLVSEFQLVDLIYRLDARYRFL